MIDPNLENSLVMQRIKQSLGEMQFQILLQSAQLEAREQKLAEYAQTDKTEGK